MQVDDVGLLELGELGDVAARVAKVDGIDAVATEVGVQCYREAFP